MNLFVPVVPMHFDSPEHGRTKLGPTSAVQVGAIHIFFQDLLGRFECTLDS